VRAAALNRKYNFGVIMDRFETVMDFFNGKAAGKLVWYLDWNKVVNIPANIKNDVELLNDFGCSFVDGIGPSTVETDDPLVRIEQEQQGTKNIKRIITPVGSLEYVSQHNHPVDYPVKTSKDCQTLKFLYDNRLLQKKEFQFATSLHQINITGSSPVQQLLQWDTGMEHFYYLAADYPEELQALLDSMHQVQIKRTSFACECNVPVIYQAENTSTTMISPYFYEKYSLPQIREQAQIVHQCGKKFVIHMCGLLYDLLDLIKQTGIDGIHSVTPPPVGNTPFEDVYEQFGDKFPIQGRFGSTQWHGLEVDEIRANLRKILSFEIVQSRPFILQVTADGIAVDYKEIKKIQYIIDEVNKDRRI
jgi:hypothetical protein